MIALAGIPRPVPGTNRGTSIGALDLHQECWWAFWRGVHLNLTSTEFIIVSCLATRRGNDLSYWRIYQIARGGKSHGNYNGDDPNGAVRSHIARIRAKFRAIDSEFDWIKNCWEFGYWWRCPTGEARS